MKVTRGKRIKLPETGDEKGRGKVKFTITEY